jgi:hypothetical protein
MNPVGSIKVFGKNGGERLIVLVGVKRSGWQALVGVLFQITAEQVRACCNVGFCFVYIRVNNMLDQVMEKGMAGRGRNKADGAVFFRAIFISDGKLLCYVFKIHMVIGHHVAVDIDAAVLVKDLVPRKVRPGYGAGKAFQFFMGNGEFFQILVLA